MIRDAGSLSRGLDCDALMSQAGFACFDNSYRGSGGVDGLVGRLQAVKEYQDRSRSLGSSLRVIDVRISGANNTILVFTKSP